MLVGAWGPCWLNWPCRSLSWAMGSLHRPRLKSWPSLSRPWPHHCLSWTRPSLQGPVRHSLLRDLALLGLSQGPDLQLTVLTLLGPALLDARHQSGDQTSTHHRQNNIAPTPSTSTLSNLYYLTAMGFFD